MTVLTDAQAKQQLDVFLDRAREEGEVLIARADGETFLVRAVQRVRSPLDAPSVPTDPTADEIVRAVRNSRER